MGASHRRGVSSSGSSRRATTSAPSSRRGRTTGSRGRSARDPENHRGGCLREPRLGGDLARDIDACCDLLIGLPRLTNPGLTPLLLCALLANTDPARYERAALSLLLRFIDERFPPLASSSSDCRAAPLELAEDTHFAVYPGHADPKIERVIWSHKGCEVVVKEGAAAEVANSPRPPHLCGGGRPGPMFTGVRKCRSTRGGWARRGLAWGRGGLRLTRASFHLCAWPLET
jgi:hypothetical protein